MAFGWFADQSTDHGELWVPNLCNEAGAFPLDGVWFFSEQECIDFINEDILTHNRMATP